MGESVPEHPMKPNRHAGATHVGDKAAGIDRTPPGNLGTT